MGENWNLDRKPSTAERAVGIAGAALLSTAGGLALWFSAVSLRSAWASIASGTFMALFAFVLVRFIGSKAQKPPRSEVIMTARAITVVSFVLLAVSFFAGESRNQIALLGLGTTGLVGGIWNLMKAKKEPNQLLRATDQDKSGGGEVGGER
jgi:hypothetical protein